MPAVSCSISPQRPVAVKETLVFTASAAPANIAISFAFDHGDGTLDPGPVSNAYYLDIGQYDVRLRWNTTSGASGIVDCGTVVVIGNSPVNCRIGLGPADGLGWWCGDVFCRQGAANPASICPTNPPYGCYTGMDGGFYCIAPPGGGPAKECLVGQGPADGFVWYCGGQLCLSTTNGCPPYPIYGCFRTVAGPTICIDPAPSPTITCTISKTQVAVNETLVFTAIQTGPQIAVEFVFDHGDGTLDPTNQSNAYYAAPGTYQVRLKWSHLGGSGIEDCGTVTVT